MDAHIHIWIWLHRNTLMKAIANTRKGTIIFYDQDDRVLMVRSGLTPAKMKILEKRLEKAGATCLDDDTRPFSYL